MFEVEFTEAEWIRAYHLYHRSASDPFFVLYSRGDSVYDRSFWRPGDIKVYEVQYSDDGNKTTESGFFLKKQEKCMCLCRVLQNISDLNF